MASKDTPIFSIIYLSYLTSEVYLLVNVFSKLYVTFIRVGVIIGKNQLDCWILENPTNSKLEKWGCIPWIFYLLENVL